MEVLERDPDLQTDAPQEIVPETLPELETSAESLPELVLPEKEAPVRPRKTRAEFVMALIAGAAALILAAVALLCIPYYGKNEDPEELPQHHQENLAPTTLPPAETEAPPQPENPTIPPQRNLYDRNDFQYNRQNYLVLQNLESYPGVDVSAHQTIPPQRNLYDRNDFQYNRQNYLVLQNLESYPGVDVSAHQGAIDWRRVRASGIEFALIRLGYRGYGSGKLVKDDYAEKNLEGAKAAGLKVGAYFFSQALNIREVDEEIDFMLEILGEHTLDMPIILDWEIPAEDARTAGKMDARTLTDLQLHFCKEMVRRGYKPMIYFNWHQSENLYNLSELEDYPFWLALYQDKMTYPWQVDMWQYSDKGRVPGISGNVDLNVYMPN